MDAVLNWIWQGCVVAVALVVALRFLERSHAHVRYVVCWTALLIVLMIPLIPLARAAASPVQSLPISAAAVSIVLVPHVWWTSGIVVIAAWALWAGTQGIRFTREMLALRRAKTCSSPFPTTVEPLLRHWMQVSEQDGRQAHLVISDRVRAAAVLGGRVPLIAVAPALVQHLDADELDRVIIHEWAHVQRRDDLANGVQLMARAIAGWHPAVWWIDRRLHIEREVACDEITVAVTGSPKSYAACLVKLASLPLDRLATLPAPGALSSTGLRGRITRIVSRRAFASPAWSRGTATVALVLLCALSVAIGRFQLIETAAVSENGGAPGTFAQATSVQPNGLEVSRVIGAESSIAQTDAPMSARTARSLRIEPPRVDPQPAASAAGGLPDAPEHADSTVESSSNVSVPIVDPAPAQAPDPVDSLLPTGNSVALDTPLAQSPVADAPARSPWETAADAGVAIGRGSKNAGVATAGFFNRFAGQIAGSF